ncbi:MAG TPA: VIT domain-containing protein [Phycisphaerae bacterium]|nr:VIT domain-containing protein [Phycisphaerae bacterium]HRW53971.1 VIT domain-containing protein [Phycisphaerae bacterium]
MTDRFDEQHGPFDNDSPEMRELDALLREWHTRNVSAAAEGRDRLLATLTSRKPAQASNAIGQRDNAPRPTRQSAQADASLRIRNWRPFLAKFSPAAAAILLIAVLIAFNPGGQRRSHADVIYAPEGGALTALDHAGRVMGPCPLKDTFVDVDISGRFARVTLWQTFHNPYHDKIEAVYTFPLSHNGAVDRMTMSIGDRVIVGEVHERAEAKQIYEAAKQQGHVAALLEQERPNIFTQSVANIEPGAEVLVEISYVETLAPKDGVCEFAFPMTVAPRYIPTSDERPLGDAERFAIPRDGVNLLAPGEFREIESETEIASSQLLRLFNAAMPIEITDPAAWENDGASDATSEVATFITDYEGGPNEAGAIYSNGTGYVGNRWFAFDRGMLRQGTAAVPDAGRILPPSASPGVRAGHNIGISVALDTGGPGISEIETPLHDTLLKEEAFNEEGLPTRCVIDLDNEREIPNRDFVLRWRPVTNQITDSVLTHTSDLGNFVTIMIDPPARVEFDELVPRELIFVIDTSGSMKGAPLDKARQVMANALEAMGPADTFNVIAFSDNATRLWETPREATRENIDDAHIFIAKHDSDGGTQMMGAVRMALESDDTVDPMADLAARARGEDTSVAPLRVVCFLTDGEVGNDMSIIDEIRQTAGRTRFFSMGIGDSVNRYLLDGMAEAGRGASDVILSNDDAFAAAERFALRMRSPVLLNPTIEFSDDLDIVDMQPETLPDLFDERPIIVHARYETPGDGVITIRGDAVNGPFERTIDVTLPDYEPRHTALSSLWARAKVDSIMNRDLQAAQQGNFPEDWRQEIVDIGETYQIMTKYTSFVAVEQFRVTLGGEPVRIHVPVELPNDWAPESDITRRLIVDAAGYESWTAEVDQRVAGERYYRYQLALQQAQEAKKSADISNGDLDGDGVADVAEVTETAYPKNWPEIAARRMSTEELGESEETRRVRGVLKTRADNVRFDEATLEDVVDELRTQTGLNIVPDWSALEAVAIEKDAVVSLDLSNVTYGKALDLILDEVSGGEVDLGVEVDEGIVRISTKDDIENRTLVHVYNVQDLIGSVPGTSRVEDATTEDETPFDGTMQSLIDRIESQIAPNSWRDAGGTLGSVDTLNSQLVVTQTRANHQKMQRLLDDLRFARESQSIDNDGFRVGTLIAPDDSDEALTEQELKQREIERKIRVSVLDSDFEVAYRMLDVARQTIEAKRNETDPALTERFRERIVALEKFIDDEAQLNSESEIRTFRHEPEQREQERIALIQETKARHISELMDRAAELRKESRLGESIQVLDQVLVIEPDNENALWMRDTLDDLEQSVRDREKISSRNTETHDLLIENDLSGLLLQFEASGSNDPPEMLDRRLSEVELEDRFLPVDRLGRQLSDAGTAPDPVEPTASLGVPFSRVRATSGASDEVDAGVPILAKVPELKARYAAMAAADEDEHAGATRGYAYDSAQAGGVGGGGFISGGYGASGRGDLRDAGGGGGGNAGLSQSQRPQILSVISSLDDPRDWAQAQTRVGQSAGVDFWTVVRGARSTPSQLISPSTTTLDASLSNVDDADDSAVFGVNSSFAYAYSHDDDKSIFGTSSDPDFPVAFALVGEAASPFNVEGYDAGQSNDPVRPPTPLGFPYRGVDVAPQDQKVYFELGDVALQSAAGQSVLRFEIRESHDSDSFGRFVANQANDPTDSGVDSGDVFFVGERYDASNADSAGGSKTPVMGDIPAVSSLFSSEQVGKDKATHAGARTRYVLPVRNLTSEEAQELIRELQAAKAQDPSVESSRTATTSSATARPSGASTSVDGERLVDAKAGRDFLAYDPRVAETAKSTPTGTLNTLVPVDQAVDVLAAAGLDSSIESAPQSASERVDSQGVTQSDATQPTAPAQTEASTPAFDRSVPEMVFDNATLESAIDQLAVAADSDIRIDAASVFAAGYDCDSTFSATIEAGSLADALMTVLRACSKTREPLDFVLTDDGLLITTQSAAERMLGLISVTYDIADFFAVEDLPQIVRETVDSPVLPPTWRMSDYLAAITELNARSQAGHVRTSVLVCGDRVSITHTRAFHTAVAGWLSGLRTARFEAPSTAPDVYRLAARIRAGLAGADDALAFLDAHPHDALARELLDAVLGQRGGAMGPTPSLKVVMADAADRLDAAAERSRTIARRLEAPLLSLMAGASPSALVDTKALKKSPRISAQGVTVSVLASDTAQASLDVMAAAGLQLEASVPAANVVVGDIPLSRLADLAMLPETRRIEAAR